MRRQTKRLLVLWDCNVTYSGPPLGCLYAARAVNAERFQVKIVHKSKDHMADILDACKGAVAFGISSVTGPCIREGLRVARRVRQVHPEVPIIWGGWQSITLPGATQDSDACDYVCRGQGELWLARMVDALDNGDRTLAREISDATVEFADPSDIPTPDLSLIDWRQCMGMSMYGRMMPVLTSFGCPYRCGFCAEINASKRRWYGLPAERVVSQLVELKERAGGYDALSILDSNFFVSESRVKAICEGMLAAGLRVPMGGVSARVNDLCRYKPETWELLREVGLKRVLIGAESASNETLREIQKDITVEQIVEAVQRCAQYGVSPLLSFVWGMPVGGYRTDPANAWIREFQEMRALVRTLRKITPEFEVLTNWYCPMPATPLYGNALAMGYAPPKDIEGWSNHEMTGHVIPWVPEKVALGSEVLCFRHACRMAGMDIASYIRALPWWLRLPGLALVRMLKSVSAWRLRVDCWSLPIDAWLCRKAESAFRVFNKKMGFLKLSG